MRELLTHTASLTRTFIVNAFDDGDSNSQRSKLRPPEGWGFIVREISKLVIQVTNKSIDYVKHRFD